METRHGLPLSITFPLRVALTLTCLIGFLLLPATGSAISLETQRERFVQAEKALNNGDLRRYSRLEKQLRDYPLLPYLEVAELSRRLSSAKSGEVQALLERLADTPLESRLRGRWLDQLARRSRWSAYREFFQPTKNVRRRCDYLHALIATGHQETAFEQVPQIWLHGRSRPKACDPVFSAWKRAGHLTPDLTWQRIALAMDKGETRLVRYLKGLLPKKERVWAERWMGLRAKPQRILDRKRFDAAHPRRNQMLLYGLNRLARTSPDQAEKAWKRLRKRYRFSPEQIARGERSLGHAYLRHDHPRALARLDFIDPADDLDLHRKRILDALQHGDWTRVLDRLDDLPEQVGAEETWRYWRGRALLAMGREREGRDILKTISRDRTYHAFLAAELIGVDYYLAHKPLHIDAQLRRTVARLPGALRTRELRALGRHPDARREWWALTRDMNPRELMAAAQLASDWGWTDQAIFTLARSDYWDDLELRFPLEHVELLQQHARDNGLTLPWVLALVRQESAFGPRAHSHAGARGLMQLMPRTARSVAKKLGKPRPRKRDLFEPETNIPLGTAYLGQVYTSLDQHPVLATAAYNAGPHRVKGWLPERTQDADIWVEGIPFKETRKYVQRVMAYAVIYQKRLGRQPHSLLALMRPIQGKLDRAEASEPPSGSNLKGES